MTIDYALEQFIYGIPVTQNGTDVNDAPLEGTGADILAITEGLSTEDAILCRSLTSTEPLPVDDNTYSEAVGIFKGTGETYILARANYRENDPALPVYQYVLIPQEVLQGISGNIKSLIEITDSNINGLTGTHQPLEPLALPPVPTLMGDRRTVMFERVLNMLDGDFNRLLMMLDMALSDDSIQIVNHPARISSRLDLLEALMLLLPPASRPELTFTTYSNNPDFSRVAVIFSDEPATGERHVFTMSEMPSLDGYVWKSTYAEHLASLWDGQMIGFISKLRALDTLSNRLNQDFTNDNNDSERLAKIAHQHALDVLVMGDDEVPIDSIKAVLTGTLPNDPILLARYAQRLMIYALENRDAEGAQLVAALMDNDQALDKKLNKTLETSLETEPDAVYSFIRAHLSKTFNERWLPRLIASATISLDVAINSSDSETLISWIRLLGREPATYELGEVLQRGILAAQARTHEDGKLGMQLLTFAVKRAHSALEMLLEDEELIATLPDPLGSALRDYSQDAVYDVLQTGRELALILLKRAVVDQRADVFDDVAIAYLWQFYTESQTSGILPRYQPGTILDILIKDGAEWLSTDALSALIVNFVEGGRNDLFLAFSKSLLQADRLFPLIMRALRQTEQLPDTLVNHVNLLLNDEVISPQQMLETFVYLLDKRGWGDANRVLIEHLSRYLGQNAPLTVPRETLWKLLDVSREIKSEITMRVSTRRLIRSFDQTQDENLIITNLNRIHEYVSWSTNGEQILLRYWREFVNNQPLAQLQQIARHVGEDTRLPDDVLSIVSTTISIRKLLGKRTLQDFAEDVSTAYTIIQLLSDSFDPSNKQSIDFDQETVRAELDTHDDELTPNERSLLAKNLKELAQLVIMMADNRSKSSLIRREGNIERQLLTGEQAPQSAIDTMKWLSGYLSGMQEKDSSDS